MKVASVRKLMALALACGLVCGLFAGAPVLAKAAASLDGVMGSEYDAVRDPVAGIWNMVSKATGEVATTISAPRPQRRGRPRARFADRVRRRGRATAGRRKIPRSRQHLLDPRL